MDGRGRARLPARQAARLPAAGRREGPGRDRRRPPIHHAARRQGLAVRAGRRRRRTASTHYEPDESPVANPLYGQQSNPARQRFRRRGTSGTERRGEFPYVFTTYRLTEHHTAGGMSRFLPYLAELQPAMFCEVSPELAAERRPRARGLGDALDRARADRGAGRRHGADGPVAVDGRPVHQIGLPYHWGAAGSHGDAANDLLEAGARPERAHPGVQGRDLRHPAGPAAARERAKRRASREHADRGVAGRRTATRRRAAMGFFTDTSSASGARPARWRARSGTACRRTAWSGAASRYDNTSELGAEQLAPRRVRRADDARCESATTARGRRPVPVAHELRRLQALHASRRASTSARPARSSGPSSAPSSSRRTSATAAATACRRARSAYSTGVSCARSAGVGRTAGSGSARSATTALARASRRRAPRRARPSRSSTGRSTSCASAPTAGSAGWSRTASTGRGSTASDRTMGSAGSARFSCCSTSRRPMGSRRRRATRPETWRRCGGRPRSRAPRSSPGLGCGRPGRAGRSRAVTGSAYYGRPILKPPVWKREIGWYLFTGGLAGGVVDDGAPGAGIREPGACATRRAWWLRLL